MNAALLSDRTEVVAFAEQLQEAEEFADLVVVLQVLPVRSCVRHAQPLRLVGSLERVEVKDTAWIAVTS